MPGPTQVGVACSGAAPAQAAGTTCTLTVALNGDGTETADIEIALRPDWAPLGVERFQVRACDSEARRSAGV